MNISSFSLENYLQYLLCKQNLWHKTSMTTRLNLRKTLCAIPHVKQVFILIFENRDFRWLAYVGGTHRQKTFGMLSRFWPLRCLGGESIICYLYEKSFFRKCWVRFQKVVKNDNWYFLRITFKIWNTITKHACIYHLILLRIPPSLVLSVKNRGVKDRRWVT